MRVTQTFSYKIHDWHLKIEVDRSPNMNGFFKRATRLFAWEDNGYDEVRPSEDWTNFLSTEDQAEIVAAADKIWNAYWTTWEIGGGPREESPISLQKKGD